ncbi:MAG: aminopeptidase P family protein, partial [Proteobacteria bacterium]|nr:aminopeptidase P family protein [Pseudomonadota bacterium]
NSVYYKRLSVLRQSLKKTAVTDCHTIWIIQPENRRYLSGFKAGDTQFTESSGSLLINETRCLLLTDSRYTLEAKKGALDFEVQTIRQDLVDVFPGLVQGMGTGKLGFEEGYLTWGLHRRLNEKLEALSPRIDLVPLNGVVEEMREVKDTREIKAIGAAADLISEILNEIIANLRPGMTEKEVAWEIGVLARDGGAEALAFPPIVASGPNSALPHAVPSDRKLRRKEPVIIDAGVRLNGYCSDITRTIFLEGPGPDFRTIYRTVRQAQSAAIEEIRPLVDSTHIDGVARDVIREAGFGEYFGHGLGHGVGLATHERPRIGPRNPVKLKKGTVITIEPGIYIPGRGGVRLEEMVLIDDNGPRILTRNDHFYDF